MLILHVGLNLACCQPLSKVKVMSCKEKVYCKKEVNVTQAVESVSFSHFWCSVTPGVFHRRVSLGL